MNTDRYVINTNFDSKWHRVNESNTGIYTVQTKCRKVFRYPSIAVRFVHPANIRRNKRMFLYESCQEVECQEGE